MSGHTPGPWHYGEMYGWGGICITRKPADSYGPQGTIGDAPIAMVVDKAAHWTTPYPVNANARLIAAAPDLLEALIDARKQLEAYEEEMNGEDYNSPRINAAIAKATGESQ